MQVRLADQARYQSLAQPSSLGTQLHWESAPLHDKRSLQNDLMQNDLMQVSESLVTGVDTHNKPEIQALRQNFLW